MLSFRTKGYNGYGVQYSPFFDNKIAVSTASNYGLVGNGRLFVLDIDASGNIASNIGWDTQDGLFDVCWSEIHENQMAVASGDGSIKIFDLTVPKFPVKNYQEHTKEVFSVNWNLVDKSNFVSSSWDGTIKLWSPQRQESMLTLSCKPDLSTQLVAPSQQLKPPMTHQANHQQTNMATSQCIYNAAFSPHSPSMILSCNGSSHLQVWDIRSPQPLQVDFLAHGGMEALSCDWNKYKSTIIASAGTDKLIRIWDLRMVPTTDSTNPTRVQSNNLRGPTPLNELFGHHYAIRKVVWSPHNGQELISCSYDMSCRVWKDFSGDRSRQMSGPPGGCVGVMNQHKEFAIGCDYSLWGDPGWAASTGWDEMVYVWDTKRLLV